MLWMEIRVVNESNFSRRQAEYWSQRLLDLIGAMNGSEAIIKEAPGDDTLVMMTRALFESSRDDLKELRSLLSGSQSINIGESTNGAQEILRMHSIAQAINLQIEDYVVYSSAVVANVGSVVSKTVNAALGVFSKISQLLKGLAKWLLNALSTATTLKEWKIGGQLGNAILGLATTNLEITFGK